MVTSLRDLRYDKSLPYLCHSRQSFKRQVVLHWTIRHHADLGMVQRLKLAPNGMPISCRKRTAETVKMAMISGAKRSAAWAGWAYTRR